MIGEKEKLQLKERDLARKIEIAEGHKRRVKEILHGENQQEWADYYDKDIQKWKKLLEELKKQQASEERKVMSVKVLPFILIFVLIFLVFGSLFLFIGRQEITLSPEESYLSEIAARESIGLFDENLGINFNIETIQYGPIAGIGRVKWEKIIETPTIPPSRILFGTRNSSKPTPISIDPNMIKTLRLRISITVNFLWFIATKYSCGVYSI